MLIDAWQRSREEREDTTEDADEDEDEEQRRQLDVRYWIW
jgi:hypothetical protein